MHRFKRFLNASSFFAVLAVAAAVAGVLSRTTHLIGWPVVAIMDIVAFLSLVATTSYHIGWVFGLRAARQANEVAVAEIFQQLSALDTPRAPHTDERVN